MATVPEEYTTEEQLSVVRFFCGQEDIDNEMFPVYG
jgi:hypothetical protein